MSTRGRRYDKEPKLNVKKVIGVLVAIAVIVMIIISIVNIVKNSGKKVEVKNYTYYTAYENEKFGVIDNEGNIIVEPSYDEIIAIPNKSKAIFVCTYDIDDKEGTYKTKVINDKNEEILSGYDEITVIDNFDSKQNVWYENNVLRVKKDGKYGLIDFDGNEVLSCEYEEIYALQGVTSNFIVKKDGNIGLVNEKGQTIIKAEYKKILALQEDYKNEYIIVSQDNKYGLISTSGEILIKPSYESIKYLGSSSLFAVKQNNNWKLYDTEENKIIIDDGYKDIVEAKSENIIVINSDGEYGIIDKENNKKIKPQYEDLKYAFSIYYIAKKDGKYGVIDTENKTIIDFEYKNMMYIENGGFIQADKTDTVTILFDNNLGQKAEGIVSEINTEIGYIKLYTDNEYKYYNFKLEEKNSYDLLTTNTLFLSKKDGKYGYINKSGSVVVDYIYDDGTEQNTNGFASVKKDGLWGSINKVGAVSMDTVVNLDDSIYIDFIGEWHLSSNGLYYEK